MTTLPNEPQRNIPAAAGTQAADNSKRNALILMVIGLLCGGLIPGIFGILGYTKADQNPEEARKLTKWGWIAFAIIWALNILLIIGYVILIVAIGGSTTTRY